MTDNGISKGFKIGNPVKSDDRRYQFDICLWLAEGKTTRQIIDLLKDNHNIRMSFANVDQNYRYSKKWLKVIKYLRQRYLKNISRIPIANKAHRLRVIQQGIDECLKWRKRTITANGTVYEMKVGSLAPLISEARKEVEGEHPVVINNVSVVNNNIKVLKDDELDGLIDGIIARGQRRFTGSVSGESPSEAA